jgi:hypothetical protein
MRGNKMKSAEITQKLAAMMSAEDRKAFGVLTPDECRVKHEAQEEAPLQRLCEQELYRRGIMAHHLSFRAREQTGYPDLTFVIAGKPFAVELKTATGKLSEAQAWMLGRMKENGWNCHVCRSFEQFQIILDNP